MTYFLQCILLTAMTVGILRLLQEYHPSIGAPSSVVLVVTLSGVALSFVLPVIEYINMLAQEYSIPYMSILWKSLAVSMLTATAADICRSSHEPIIAERVELLGKCELLAISLPLLRELTELIVTISDNTL